MTVLIAFATIEGQTGKIARFVETEIRKARHDVVIFNVADETRPISFDGVDKVILAAPVHERRHPEAFEVFLAGQRHELQSRHTLLISVSLSAAFGDGLEEANDYVVEMKMRTGFSPSCEALVAGAVRGGGYDHFQYQVVRHVVLRDRDYEPGTGEHEFTDWQALSGTIANFLRGPTSTR
jgi:menaquinone-dependent protoporphyrinogen oxidase